MEKEFGYARVSSTSQSLDRQIEALLDYGIEERNIIVDKQSGKDFNRTGYLSLKENLLRSGDTLVVKELDRLARNKQLIKEELEWFRANNIRVKILNVPTSLIDCGDQSWVLDMVSNILIEVMASIAEEERIKIHQRQSEGIACAKEKGVSKEYELCFLLAHGIMHLLGFDHQTEEDYNFVIDLQNKALGYDKI